MTVDSLPFGVTATQSILVTASANCSEDLEQRVLEYAGVLRPQDARHVQWDRALWLRQHGTFR